jgi:DNA-directed RNA polymerase subunit RPC12/RpoP
MAVKITLADVIKANAQVRMHCEACQHSAVLSASLLAERHGETARLDELERKARCTACGSRNIECRPEYPKASGAGGMSG